MTSRCFTALPACFLPRMSGWLCVVFAGWRTTHISTTFLSNSANTDPPTKTPVLLMVGSLETGHTEYSQPSQRKVVCYGMLICLWTKVTVLLLPLTHSLMMHFVCFGAFFFFNSLYVSLLFGYSRFTNVIKWSIRSVFVTRHCRVPHFALIPVQNDRLCFLPEWPPRLTSNSL